MSIKITRVVRPVSFSRPAGPRGVGVPPGGSTGQVLTKSSGADYDTTWAFGGGGGGSSTFIGLIDTPASFIAGRIVAVNSAADALEFVVLGISDISGLTASLAGKADATHTHSAGDITTGTLADARVAASNVTQHQASLVITESQISDLGAYITDITGSSIADLSDVTVSVPANGEILAYQAGIWVNQTLAEVGISQVGHTHTLTDIADSGSAAALDVGTTAGTVAAGDDARFSDARTPTAHAASHSRSGSDAINVADLSSGAAMPGQVPTADGAGGIGWSDQTGGGGAPTSAQFVVLAADAALTNERVLTAGNGIDIIDGGAGNAVAITVLADEVDHDGLLNFVATEHVDHTTVSITAGVGLTGGGTIASTRTLDLNTGALTIATTLVGVVDTFPFHNGSAMRRITWADMQAQIALFASQITGGTFADARISETSVTQHEGALTIGWSQLTGVPLAFPPSLHSHSLIDITDAGGAAALDVGTSAGTVAAGDDARFSQVVPHAASHASGGSDEIVPAMIGAAKDVHTHAAGDIISGELSDIFVSQREDLGVGWDGGGSPLTTGNPFRRGIERAAIVKAASIVADQTGSMSVDVRKYTPSAGLLGNAANLGTITLANAVHTRTTGLAWSLAEGDVLEFEIASASTVQRATITLKAEAS